MIGIRLANNSFFPVLDEGQPSAGASRASKKRLILTTVTDDQPTVQIDLYRGSEKDVSRDSYLASLSVENIQPMRAGEPEIELIMGTDPTGKLDVRAYDRGGGNGKSLSVSLQELPEADLNATPDFSIGDDFATPDSFGDYEWDSDPLAEEAARSTVEEETKTSAQEVEQEERRPFPWLVFILLAAGVIAIVVLAYFLLRTPPAETIPAMSNQTSAVSDAPTKPATSAPAPSATPSTEKPAPPGPAPAASPREQSPAPVPRDGVWYRIAYGDTLWDLAYSFYNNPRQFGRIAQRNNIPNPNRIYGGHTIFIPLDKNEQNSSGK